MERLTYDFCIGDQHCWQIKGADSFTCKEVCENQGGCKECPIAAAFDRLAAYEDTGLEPDDIYALRKREQVLSKLLVQVSCGYAVSYTRLTELAQAEKAGRLVVLEPAAREGEKKPPCFYSDMGQDLCLGFARGECDDEPVDRCKECWYCESTREEVEAALKKREDGDNEAD